MRHASSPTPPANASPFFFFNDTATTEIYTLSLHDALPISAIHAGDAARLQGRDRPCQVLSAQWRKDRAEHGLAGLSRACLLRGSWRDLPAVGGPRDSLEPCPVASQLGCHGARLQGISWT